MPKLYSLEFRQEAVRLLCTSGRPVKLLASELGISPSTLRSWARELAPEASVAPIALSSDERDELRRLRREVRVLAEEREILKKAAAFFATESTR